MPLPLRSDAPVIEQLTIREITVFLKDTDSWSDVSRTRFPGAALGKTLESEWGLALHIESRKGTEARRYLLDFGFTPDVYANNLELMKIDLGEVDALMRPLDPLKGLSVAPGNHC
jgi:metal-dependent hydrolase (beta-lactamase superfamily II)